jgi:hypothetical protein
MKRVLITILLLLSLLVGLFPVRTALAQGEVDDPIEYLEGQGYTLVDIGDGVTDQGESYAAVIMEWAGKKLWESEETSVQVWHGFYALRGGYPDAVLLVPILVYSEQYEVVFKAKAADWDEYQKSQDWNAFVNNLFIGIWDNEANEFLEGIALKKFVKKEFGAGTVAEPKLPGPIKDGHGNVTIEASEIQVKPKDKADLTVTVLDMKKEPVEAADVELSVSGTATGSTVRPKATSTDEKGIAEATFIAGATEGSAVVTADSGGTRGTVTIQVGAGGPEDPSAKVIAALEEEGYKVYSAGPLEDNPSVVAVDMDLAGYFVDKNGNVDPETIVQVAYGWVALMAAYPDAVTLVVITRYENYGIVWPAEAQDLKAVTDKKLRSEDFWAGVFSSMSVIDLKTGKEVPVKDFINKNFT